MKLHSSPASGVNEPLEGSFIVNLLETGTYELLFTVNECEAVDFEAVLTRIRVPSDNRDRVSAALIEEGSAVASVMGCAEERWFQIEVDDGDSIRMDLGGVSIVQDDNGVFRMGSAALDLMDANGDNVIASGNPVSVTHDIDGTLDETTLEFSFETGGTYFLKSYYWNGCTIGDIYARYHVL